MKQFWLFQTSPAGLSRKKTTAFWAWNLFLILASGICLGGVSLLFAYGSYSPNVFYSYFTHPLILLLNLLPVVGLELLAWCLTGRGAPAFFLAGFVTLGFSIADYYKLLFRDDPLMFQDLRHLREAMSITETASYDLTPDKRVVFGVLCLIFGTVVLHFTARGVPGKKSRFAVLAVLILACFPVSRAYTSERVYNTLTANYDHVNRWAATQNYLSKGFVYPFLHSITAGVAKVPEGYGETEAEALLFSHQDGEIPQEKKVDLITIQLEAFSDFSRFAGVEGIDFVSAYKTFHEIEAESYTGDLVTNIFAGGTVDTERAFLTGFADLRDFRADTNSSAWYLQSQGYLAEGSHPSYQWFYNRRNINGYLGLPDYYYFENYYNEVDSVNLAADRLLFPEIFRLYGENRDGEGKPYFSFNVTYQGHGPYSSTENQWGGRTFTDGRYSTETTYIVDNYLASVADTAEELKKLMDAFREEERPVVLVVYGDHKPWLGDGNSAYQELGVNLDASTEEGFYNYYSTRYLIWANGAAKAALENDFVGEGPTLSSCFLMNEVFAQCGWTGSAWMQAANEVRSTLPVITSVGRYVENGVLTDTLTPEGQAALRRFLFMEYYETEHFRY